MLHENASARYGWKYVSESGEILTGEIFIPYSQLSFVSLWAVSSAKSSLDAKHDEEFDKTRFELEPLSDLCLR